MYPIFLIGFMGSGKSTVGKALSERNNLAFVDTDEYIEKKQRMEITKIFEKFGEDTFRKFEHEALQDVQLKNIIATGGGIVERKENISFMKDKGTIVYLHATFREIDRRLQDDASRPLWLNSDLETRQRLFARRDELYRGCSDHTILTDQRTITNIVDELMHKIPFN